MTKINHKWRGVLLHAIITLLVISVYYLEGDPSATLFIGGIACSITYIYLAIREGKSFFLRINPLSFYFFWYSFGLGLSAIYASIIINSGENISFVVKVIEPDDVAFGYLIFLIGSLSLHAGIELCAPKRHRDMVSVNQLFTQGNLITIIMLWSISLIASFHPELVAWMGSLGPHLQRLSLACVALITLKSSEHLGFSKPVYIVCIVIGTLGAFFASLMSNSKAGIMFTFVPIVWMFIVRKDLWRYTPYLLIGLISFYFGIVAPVVMTARGIELRAGETYAQRIIRVYQSFGAETHEAALEYKENGLELFLMRQFDAPAVGCLVDDVRAYGFRLGETLQHIVYAFIPRIVWPEKPTVTRGGWFYAYAGGQKEEGDSDTSLGITAVGEYYWNFGVPGVLIGMLLIGCMIGFLWRMAGYDPRSTVAQMLLFFTLVVNMPNMADVVTVLTANTILFLIFGILIKIQNFHKRAA